MSLENTDTLIGNMVMLFVLIIRLTLASPSHIQSSCNNCLGTAVNTIPISKRNTFSSSTSSVSSAVSSVSLSSSDLSTSIPARLSVFGQTRRDAESETPPPLRHGSPIPPNQSELFKQELLNKLGMDRPPTSEEIANANISREHLQEMYELYHRKVQQVAATTNRILNEETPISYVDHMFTFRSTGSPPPNISFFEWYSSRNLRLFLPIDFQQDGASTVHKAILYLFIVSPNLQSGPRSVLIRVYQLRAPVRRGSPTPRRFITSKRLSISESGWIRFSIDEAVADWIADPDSNYGLEVVCDTMYISNIIADRYMNDNGHAVGDEDRHPRVNIVVREHMVPPRGQRRRRRRQSDLDGVHDMCNQEGSRCCRRYNLTVSFQELDINWILAPKEYNARYCGGDCPQFYNLANTHTFIRTLMRAKGPSAAPQPCCVPSVLGSLPVLHYVFENDRLTTTLTPLPDMVVERCSCM